MWVRRSSCSLEDPAAPLRDTHEKHSAPIHALLNSPNSREHSDIPEGHCGVTDAQQLRESFLQECEAVCVHSTEHTADTTHSAHSTHSEQNTHPAHTPADSSSVLQKALGVQDSVGLEEMRAVCVNGSIIFLPETSVMTLPLQRPPDPSMCPAVPVPLPCTHDPALDRSAALISAFSRFPYPTPAELTGLTAASTHPEQQIRLWFSTQRLKQGISWSPEEVEEARKKMFNGSTVLSTAGVCEQTPDRASPPCTSAHPSLKCSSGSAVSTEVKRAEVTPDVYSLSGISEMGTSSPAPPEACRTPPAEEKLPMVNLQLKIPHSVLPKERLPLSPIVSTNVSRSLTHQQTDSHVSASAPESRFGSSVLCTAAAPCSRRVSPWVYDHSAVTQTSCAVSAGLFPAPCSLLEQQMKLLEKSFQKNSCPSYSEVESLQISSRLSREDVESWFVGRRAHRDGLEQALLSSMGCKPVDSSSISQMKTVLPQSRWPSPGQTLDLKRWLREPKQTCGQRSDWRPADNTKHTNTRHRQLRDRIAPQLQNWLSSTGSSGEVYVADGEACGGWRTGDTDSQ
ncbi:zinc fingers and homeoboxes protein 2 [Danio rerio]|uniref:Zinc fingers and homeoboxes protein 2 n=8 Tax=Danio rerio TaxID=7955 RepID=A0A8M2BH92_DANRE|nr:zinc fingers and homeoboxes protein 2-like [Danio rerio]XP_009292183.1 zinc fingers and homeoboxes protein 2-like [Danio rerio]|eukprot:XP_005170030.1 zinc fingers and homeoboxes protein 2-like [Danio rerio]